jgi:hypothetical protein
MEKGTDICLAEIAFLILRNIPNGYSKEEKDCFGNGVITMLNTLQSTLDILKENSNINMEDIENIIKKEILLGKE